MNIKKINWPNALRDLSCYLDEVTERAESAEHSADRWQSRAESAEARVEELEVERDEWHRLYSSALSWGRTFRDERDDLRAENARLEKELSTTGEDSERRFMEVGRLTEERDDLSAEDKRLLDLLDKRHAEREELLAEHELLAQEAQFAEMRESPVEQEIKILRAENERLRTAAPEDADEGDDFPCCQKRGGCDA